MRELQILWERSDARCAAGDAAARAVTLTRFWSSFPLKDELDAAWAARPLDLVREGDRRRLRAKITEAYSLERDTLGVYAGALALTV